MLLQRGKKSTSSKEELEKIQAGHMENIGKLAKAGKLLVAGPMGDDTDLRGIFILDCETIEEAKALVDTDPAVKAGRLRPEYHPWWTARGTVIK
ncbi:MAG: YciI family protein [Bacteroidia bacterium]